MLGVLSFLHILEQWNIKMFLLLQRLTYIQAICNLSNINDKQ